MIHPRISVLMPVYNGELYVREAIESMLNQTFTDFELLVLDDGSTDRTEEIVLSFNDSRIRYHRNASNIGIANNLNIGLAKARGEYIARFDGDDVSLPDRLQVQINFLDTHPDVGLCSTAMQLFGKHSEVWIREHHPEAIKITMLFYSPVLHASSMFRRRLFLDHELTYRQEAFPAEDYELWSRAVKVCKLVNLPDVLYNYRIHDTQVPKTDRKATDCIRKIQLEYLASSVPTLPSASVAGFFEQFVDKTPQTTDDVRVMKQQIDTLIQANKQTGFFDNRLLKTKLNRVLAGKVFHFVVSTHHFTWYLLSKLRFRQLVKLVHVINN